MLTKKPRARKLPTCFVAKKNFYDSVYIVVNENSEAILKKIIAEEKISFNNFSVYGLDAKLESFVKDLKNSQGDILFISTQINDDIITLNELQKRGIKLDGDIEFFHLEHLKHCEKIFHNLGK